MPNQSLDSPEAVELLVTSFYAKVQVDPLLGPVFNNVAQVDWPTHLSKIIAFWSSLMLGTDTYRGNAMRPHFEVALKTSFTPAHFDRWLALFEQTLNEHFSGEHAHEALIRAQSIAAVMQSRLYSTGLLTV